MTTASFGHGLVLGKFYPPHLGHHRLVELAARRCHGVTVLVMAARSESLSLADRVGLLRAAHRDQANVDVIGIPCDVPVDFASATVWDAQVALVRAALRNADRAPVDAVFSSEPYGAELAARLSALAVEFDRERLTTPVSGTRVRADLAGNWDFLAPSTRAALATRVVFVGAESTGTTTLAERVAQHYRDRGGIWARTACVAEYGREWTEVKWAAAVADAVAAGREPPTLDAVAWSRADFDLVAAEQTRREEVAAAAGSPLLVCDTDAFATAVWERRYLGDHARTGQPWATELLPRHDLYLLTTHEDVPWHDDGLREGDLAVRAAMTGWFADALTGAGHSWAPLTGSLGQRQHLAIAMIDYALAQRATFGPPAPDITGSVQGWALR